MGKRDDLFAFTDEERAYLREGRAQADALLSPQATRHEAAIYEASQRVDADAELVRPAFVCDVDRILNNAFYNRCMDKTQVFPFYRNDDLSRRSYHLQLVSHIARKIGTALRMNTSLIEAIALGHDMGHTPFGHGGERFLNEVYQRHTGRFFNHNVQSVRILKDVATCRLSLQTFNGMLCHCGEKAFAKYEPGICASFAELGDMMERCYTVAGASQTLRPNTLEGCIVRICDILAYLGKDRQDALNIGAISKEDYALDGELVGATNSQIIGNATTNLIKNSIGHDYLAMDQEVLESLLRIKDDNSAHIYSSPAAHETLDARIKPMLERLYERFRADIVAGNEDSFVFRHHIDSWVMQFNPGYVADNTPDDIVVDYISSMTDEYFIDLYNKLYPEDAFDKDRYYHSYFE